VALKSILALLPQNSSFFYPPRADGAGKRIPCKPMLPGLSWPHFSSRCGKRPLHGRRRPGDLSKSNKKSREIIDFTALAGGPGRAK